MGLGGCRVGDGFYRGRRRGGLFLNRTEKPWDVSANKADSIGELIRIKTNLNRAAWIAMRHAASFISSIQQAQFMQMSKVVLFFPCTKLA